AAMTGYPSATNSGATPFQLEESANAPWTRMIVGFPERNVASLAWTESAMEAMARMPNSINRLISVFMEVLPIEYWGAPLVDGICRVWRRDSTIWTSEQRW